MARILVVDDDTTVATVLLSYLTRAGHVAHGVGDGLDALERIAAAPPDLIVLDLMLPGLDGLELCRRLRDRWPLLPVIMLTSLAEQDDRIVGLETGADDYVPKPFSPRELVLRIESVLRRAAAPPPAPGPLTAGSLTVDPAARRVYRDGAELTLTVRELDLLTFLLRNPSRAFSREQLMREVWGWTVGDQSTVTVHVRRLREKIEDDPTNPSLVRTVWGVGYRLEVPA